MRYIILTVGFGLVLLIDGITAQAPVQRGTNERTGTPTVAGAALADSTGRAIGQARLQQTPNGVLLLLELRNATPGVHAFHIHEVGSCDRPSFESAGDHLAFGGQHGLLNVGAHAGDLPNIYVPASTQLSVEYLIPDVTVDPGPRTLLDANGSSLVVHANKDDYASQPAGAAGDRLACGRIEREAQK
jgi:Cu-Zn family superoxide dismutase